jgi:hypothetical protein
MKRPDRLSPGKTQKPKGRPIGPPLPYGGGKLVLAPAAVKWDFVTFFVRGVETDFRGLLAVSHGK